MYLCARCNERKPAEAFELTWFKKHGKGWNCKDCQAGMLQPACLGCHQRPAKPLVHPVHVDDAYICTTCRYPKCKNCKEKERPHGGKYRCYWSRAEGQIKDSKPNWTCAECVAKGILAEVDRMAAVEQEKTPADGIPKRVGTIRGKTCQGCSMKRCAGDFRSLSHQSSGLSEYCKTCENPQCGHCGTAYTGKRAFKAGIANQWYCGASACQRQYRKIGGW